MTDGELQELCKARINRIIERLVDIAAFADTEECNFPPFECNDEQQSALDEWLNAFMNALEQHVRGTFDDEWSDTQGLVREELERVKKERDYWLEGLQWYADLQHGTKSDSHFAKVWINRKSYPPTQLDEAREELAAVRERYKGNPELLAVYEPGPLLLVHMLEEGRHERRK